MLVVGAAGFAVPLGLSSSSSKKLAAALIPTRANTTAMRTIGTCLTDTDSTP